MRPLYLFWVSSVVAATAVPWNKDGRHYPPVACPMLANLFPEQVFYPNTSSYLNQSTAVYSKTCVLSPSCVFVPRTVHDVSKGLHILTKTKTQFAVKGAGHMPIPGAQSTNHGVMMPTSNLTTAELVKSGTVLRLGPGHTWEQVYNYLAPHNLSVVGGRYGPVGVGGLLLGGGIDYFGNQRGWATNSVLNYEVVLANSSIVNANAKENKDLYWALKGGANNFGIVTRFDLKTYPSGKVFGGTMAFGPSETSAFLNAVTSFLAPDGGVYDKDVALNPCIFPSAATKSTSSNIVAFHQGPDTNPESLKNFTSLTATTQQIGEYNSFDMFTQNPNIDLAENRGNNHFYWATSIYPTPEAIKILNETLTDAIYSSSTLAKVQGASVGLCMQPITAQWLQAARDSGGDAIDLDPAKGTFLAVLLPTSWANASDTTFMMSFVGAVVESIEKKAKKASIYYPFVYLNDAVRHEHIFEHYGSGKSLPRMRAISRAVDPTGVFQTLSHGPFKLGMF